MTLSEKRAALLQAFLMNNWQDIDSLLQLPKFNSAETAA
jgi:hypothetical protein